MPQSCCAGAQKSGTQPRHLRCPLGRQECPPGTAQPQCHEPAPSWQWEMPQKGWESGNSFKQIHCTTKQSKGISEPPHSIEFLFSHTFQDSHPSSPPGFPDLRQSCSTLQTLGVFPCSMASPLPPLTAAHREPWNTQEQRLPTFLTSFQENVL